MTNTPPPPPSAPNRFNLLAVLGIFVLAVIGVAFLVLGVVLLSRGGTGLPASAAASPTHLAAASTQVVLIPTTTQSPPTATPVPTDVLPSATVPPASPTAAASATSAALITISRPANVRTGPGQTYPIIGGINVGETAPAIGRDSSSQWFAISFAAGQNGTGWVSALVATYAGNVNDLPVVEAAAPPPPPQATAVPATNTGAPPPPQATSTPNVQGAGGIQTQLWQMHKTSGATNESMFFDFKVVNTTGTAITYGILAAHTDVGVTADSWHDPLQPGKLLSWTDHINFPNPGTYQVYLGICYDSHDVCKAGGTWVRLSNSIAVTIQ